MRLGGARHGDGVALVLEAVVGFVLDRRLRRLLLHAGLEAAALDHEAVDDAMEDGVVVVPASDVGEEVLDRLRRLVGVEFEGDDAVVGVQFDHVCSLICLEMTAKRDSMTTGCSGHVSGENGPPAPVGVLGDLLDDVHALDDLAEHGVAVAGRRRVAEVEHVVVGHVDEELRGRRMRIGGARHGDGAGIVLQAVAGFVLDRGARLGFSWKFRSKPPPWIMKPSMTRWKMRAVVESRP